MVVIAGHVVGHGRSIPSLPCSLLNSYQLPLQTCVSHCQQVRGSWLGWVVHQLGQRHSGSAFFALDLRDLLAKHSC